MAKKKGAGKKPADADTFLKGLMDYLDAGPSPFHAVRTAVNRLQAAGYEVLDPRKTWEIREDGRYVITRNGSSLIAFTGSVLQPDRLESGIRMFGAHTDSPCLRVKPEPVLDRHGYFQVGVEVYGGALFAPWFDRDLSLAGRVAYRDSDGGLQECLVDWQRAIAVVPSLAIHLDRDVNNQRKINPQQELPPVLMLSPESVGKRSFHDLVAAQIRQDHPDASVAQVLDYELSFYDTQHAARVGLNQEFLTSARLDNLMSCHIGLEALIAADGAQPALLVLNDHEEVGSVSAEGASGPMLTSVLRRLAEGEEYRLFRALEKSVLLSADNAHAIHPNFSDRHDGNHGPRLNAGPVIKINNNQRYATNALTAGLYRQLSAELDLPCQTFVTRTDMGCGSTIGPLSAAELGCAVMDIGVPQWAMHSVREMCGVEDPYTLFQVATRFFQTETLLP